MSGLLLMASTHAHGSEWRQLSQPAFYSPLDASAPVKGEISSMVQDQQGFMWLFAGNGLWRWDSKSLVKAQLLIPSSFNGPVTVYNGFTDTNGTVWACTSHGLFKQTPGTVKFHVEAPSLINGLSLIRGTAVELQDTEVLLLASDKALYQYTPATNRFITIEMPDPRRIHALFSDSQKNLWVGTSQGLYTSQLNQGETAALSLLTLFPQKARVSAITSTTSGQLIVGTAADGLFIQQVDGTFAKENLPDNATPWLYSIAEIRPDVLLLGTFGEGLIELDLASHQQRQFLHNRLLPAGVADNNIWSVYAGTDSLVWVGSGDSLQVYRAGSNAPQHIFADVNQPGGLSHRKVKALAIIGNTLAVAAGDQGVEMLSASQGVISRLWPNSGDPVETLFVDKNNQLLAAANFATVAISPDSQQVTPLSIGGRSQRLFSTAFAESERALWVGGTDGLWQQQKPLPGIANLEDGKPVVQQAIASLLADSNTLWIGTWQGLMQGKLTHGLLRSDTISDVNHPGLSKQFIADLFKDSLGKLWVATSGNGLFIYEPQQANWTHLATKQGLPGNQVSAFAGESNNHVWLATTGGIAAVNPRTMQVKVVAGAIDAINAPYGRGAATVTAQNEVVFGGANGLTVLSPSLVNAPSRTLKIVLTDLTVTDSNNNRLTPATNGEAIRIAPLPKRIAFEFIALDYWDPAHLSYRYRLAGLDDSWTYLDSNHRTVTLLEPAPGIYQLEVQYAENGFDWQPLGLKQTFEVAPAWFQTLFARTGAIALLFIAIVLLHRLGLRHYRYRQAQLEAKIEARTAQLRAANQKLSQQAAELEKASLTDALTGLYNRRFLSQNIQRDLSIVHRYYNGCERTHTIPDYHADVLFFVIDLDHFKRINDTYGHNTGDKVLIETKQRLSGIFRDTDYVIRWGGEEFLAVVQATSRQEGQLIAERIVKAVNSKPYSVNTDTSIDVTCSVGFAAYPLSQRYFSEVDWQSTVGIADAALYAAKRNNRNTWTGVISINENVSETTLELIQQQPSRVFDHATVLVGR
ncbi:GGDEF domain-containing protein [Alteromonas lipolytica]|nr:GGDEF domain-containing protein [Alteromonas lipolytica]